MKVKPQQAIGSHWLVSFWLGRRQNLSHAKENMKVAEAIEKQPVILLPKNDEIYFKLRE